jgi:hypothetical protein
VISQLSLSADGAQLLLQQPDLFVRGPSRHLSPTSITSPSDPLQPPSNPSKHDSKCLFIAICCSQIPQLVDIVRVGNQSPKGDALAAVAACVVRPIAIHFFPYCSFQMNGLPSCVVYL